MVKCLAAGHDYSEGYSMTLGKKLNAIIDGTIGAGAILAAVLVAFVTVAVLLEITMRYFLNRPQVWVLEIVEYCLLFITMLGAAWVLKREGHVKMDIVLDRLKPENQAMVNVITSIIGAVIFLVIAWYGALVTWDNFVRDFWIASELEPPRAPILAIIPIGSFLLFTQFLRRAYGYLRSWRMSRERDQR